MAVSQDELVKRVAAVSGELYIGGSRIFPSVRLAQAILETGGQAPSWNNIFGIKVGTGEPTPYWDGRYVNRTTREVLSGQVHENVMAQWRYYETIEDCVRDHELFLSTPRYAQVRAAAAPQEQCGALYAAGYATDPSYAEKLWSLIKSRSFLAYDADAARRKQELADRFAALEAGLGGLSGTVLRLEERSGFVPAPGWAAAAAGQAAAAGLVDTPEGGSVDFYRLLTVLRRMGRL